jgi:hypothetical protein
MTEGASATPAPVGWRRGGHLAWRRIGEEAVLLDLERRVVYGLNLDGAAVLDWLAEPRRAPPTDGALGRFLARLAADGLLELTAADDESLPAATVIDPQVLWAEPLATFALQCPSPSLPQSVCFDPGCQS